MSRLFEQYNSEIKRVCKKNSNTATLWKSLNWKKSLSTSALVMQ